MVPRSISALQRLFAREIPQLLHCASRSAHSSNALRYLATAIDDLPTARSDADVDAALESLIQTLSAELGCQPEARLCPT